MKVKPSVFVFLVFSIVFFGWIIVGTNFTCFCIKTQNDGFSKEAQRVAEEAVERHLEFKYGLTTLDTFHVKLNDDGIWIIDGEWRADSRERHDSQEYVCMAKGRYNVMVKYNGREDRFYDYNYPIYKVMNYNVLTDYVRDKK